MLATKFNKRKTKQRDSRLLQSSLQLSFSQRPLTTTLHQQRQPYAVNSKDLVTNTADDPDTSPSLSFSATISFLSSADTIKQPPPLQPQHHTNSQLREKWTTTTAEEPLPNQLFVIKPPVFAATSNPTTAHMNIFLGEKTIKPEEIHKLKRRGIRTIHHLYQSSYAGGAAPTGLGDFIRGCFFILQFCRRHGFRCNIAISHPIGQFLSKPLVHPMPRIPLFADSNLANTHIFSPDSAGHRRMGDHTLSEIGEHNYITYLSVLPVIAGNVFSYCSLFPTMSDIAPEDVARITCILQPSPEMSRYVQKKMEQLRLQPGKYRVIQIRSGDARACANADESARNGQFTVSYLRSLLDLITTQSAITETENAEEKTTVVISDNTFIKQFLSSALRGGENPDNPEEKRKQKQNYAFMFDDIAHIADRSATHAALRGTLTDFFIMSAANRIMAITIYPHGSGFSYWCSKLYNIPYTCFYLPADV